MDGEATRHRRRAGGPGIDVALAGFALAVAVGLAQLLTGAAPGRTLRATLPYAAGLLTLAVMRRQRRAGRDHLELWTVGLAALGSVLAAWVLVRCAVALPGVVGEPFGFYRLKGRITTPLGDHNTAAGLLLPPLVATAVLASRDAGRAAGRDHRWRPALVLVALGLATTLSRGAAAVLAVVVVAAWVVASRRQVAVALTAALGLVAAVLMIATVALDTAPPPGTAPPGAAGATAADGRGGVLGASVLGRVDLVVRGVETGAERPLTGAGLGAFGNVAANLPEPNDHAHQQFAHAAAEGGVPLAVAAALVAGALAVRAWRLPPSPRRDLVALGGGGLLVHAQFEILAGRLGFEVLLAVLVGLAATVAPATPDSLRAPADPP